MKIFDCHSDLLCNVTSRRQAGEKNIVKTYHEPALKKGNVGAILCNIWVDPPYAETDPTGRMLEIIGSMSAERREHPDSFHLATSVADIERLWAEDKIAYMLGVEGLSGIRGKIAFLETLYSLGIRQAMLTWNEENELATGAAHPDSGHGLTPLGVEAVRLMEDLGMIVDVSHANEKTFWDIARIARRPFIASHSNVHTLCPVARNLTDNQLKAVRDARGIVGLNAWADFIDPVNKSAERLADHVDYMAELIGIDYIGCGFDFCDYLSAEAMSFAGSEEHAVTKDLEDVTKLPAFFNILKSRGYSEEDLEKIAYRNFFRVLKETGN